MRLRSLQAVTAEREQLEFAVDAFLRSRGWHHSSNNPACIWLWERVLPDGRHILLSKEAALQFERLDITPVAARGGK